MMDNVDVKMRRAAELVTALERTPESVWTRDACLCVGDALRQAAVAVFKAREDLKKVQHRPCLPPGIVFVSLEQAEVVK